MRSTSDFTIGAARSISPDMSATVASSRKIVARERLLFRELLPKFERLMLARARKITRHGANCFRLVRPKLIRGERFVPRIVPLLFVEQRYDARRMSSRLPAFDRACNRMAGEDDNRNNDHKRNRKDEDAPAFDASKAKLFRGEHDVTGMRHGDEG